MEIALILVLAVALLFVVGYEIYKNYKKTTTGDIKEAVVEVKAVEATAEVAVAKVKKKAASPKVPAKKSAAVEKEGEEVVQKKTATKKPSMKIVK